LSKGDFQLVIDDREGNPNKGEVLIGGSEEIGKFYENL